MKVIILAGGMGTRLGSITETRPKPLVYIGSRPIIWHIMKHYSSYGFNEFIICLGYKGDDIRDFFLNYAYYTSDFTIDMATKSITDSKVNSENWKVTLLETGIHNMTGSRIRQVLPHLGTDDCFMLTYGDGVSDIDIGQLVAFHREHDSLATLTAVHPIERFGMLEYDEQNTVHSFKEKIAVEDTYINGGFFVLSREVFSYIAEGSDVIFEQEPLKKLAADRQLKMYRHEGFWQCMDTPRDMQYLNELWVSGKATWKTWR